MEAVVAHFKVLGLNLPGGTEENHKISGRIIGLQFEI